MSSHWSFTHVFFFQIAIEAVSNIRTVASLGREDGFYKEYVAEMSPANKIILRNNHIRGVTMGIARSAIYFAYAICMYFGARLIENDGVPYEDVYKYVRQGADILHAA